MNGMHYGERKRFGLSSHIKNIINETRFFPTYHAIGCGRYEWV